MTCKKHKNYILYALKVKQVRGVVWVNLSACNWLDLMKDSGNLLRFISDIKTQEDSNWWIPNCNYSWVKIYLKFVTFDE